MRAPVHLARFILVSVMVILASAVALRIALALWSTPVKAACLMVVGGIAAYCTFLLEGLSVAAGRLRDVDAEALDRHARVAYPGHHQKIMELGRLLRGKGYKVFLIGQQLLAILLVLGIQQALEELASTPSEICKRSHQCQQQDWIAAHSSPWWRDASWAESAFATYLVSSLLVCWLFQLGPGLLAENREVGFLRLPGTMHLVRLGRMAATAQLGYPGQLCARIARQVPWLATFDQLGLSSREVYEDLRRSIGVCIESYDIEIELFDDRTTVTETTIYGFHTGSVRSLQHRLTPPVPIPGIIGFNAAPVDLAGSSPAKWIIERIERVEADGRTTELQVICYDMVLNHLLPRKPGKPDMITVKTSYDVGPLAASSAAFSRFDFTAQKPLAKMRLAFRERGGIRIVEGPFITVKYPGEIALPMNGNRPKAIRVDTEDGPTFRLENLVHASRIEVRMDARN